MTDLSEMTASAPSADGEGVVPGADLTALRGRTFAAVLFDLDGTLLDSTAAVLRTWLTWAGERGIEAERLQGYHGVPAADIVRDLLPAEQVAAGVARINELELLDVRGITVLPGAAEALAALPAGRAAVVTSCTDALAAARIGATRLDVPGVLVAADHVHRGKPDPEPFLLAAERLAVPPESCLVVEDAPSGLAAARAAGMATLAVTTTTPALDLQADVVVGTLADVAFVVDDGGVRIEAAVPAE